MSCMQQKFIFKDLCRCHTKRRIGRLGPPRSTRSGQWFPTFGKAPHANPSFDVTMTKIFKDAFLQHTIQLSCHMPQSKGLTVIKYLSIGRIFSAYFNECFPKTGNIIIPIQFEDQVDFFMGFIERFYRLWYGVAPLFYLPVNIGKGISLN